MYKICTLGVVGQENNLYSMKMKTSHSHSDRKPGHREPIS